MPDGKHTAKQPKTRCHVPQRRHEASFDADLYRTPSYSGWGGFTVKW
jgi:hypothetical protein